MDVARYRLRRGGREIPLRPKSWDVLHCLVTRAGLLVTKDALHREVWPDTAVSDDTLTQTIGDLRRALGDTRRPPRFIETVHRRGFRFVAEVREVGGEARAASIAAEAPSQAVDAAGGEPAVRFVGREAELRRLHECLGKAHGGDRQVVFITGEAGIGKTTLSEEFLRSPALHAPDIRVLHGQCIQQHGQREPYMPVLEALERALAGADGAALIPLFRRVAPCWYVQIPWLLSEGEPAGFQGSMMAAPPERMLREIGAFLESAAASSTIVLVLEDLHWSDGATCDLISFLAGRRDPARLLIIGTFRPAEASTLDHPIREVRQTLRARRRAVDMTLDYLSGEDVRAYIVGRFGEPISSLAPLIHWRTDGNPLFVVAIVEDLIRRGKLARADAEWTVDATDEPLEHAVPEDLREMVTAQFESLADDERAVLEAASVVGMGFAPETVARALGRDAEAVEAVALRMARAHLFLHPGGSAENRGPADRYDFTHALHHQAIYEQIPPLRRQRLHLTVGEALESTSGERIGEVAAELSVHFERGADPLRAAKYLGTCAARAQQRQAPHEAIACAELSLQLLDRVPDSPDRRRRELEVRLLLGVSLNLTRGYGSPAVRDNYARARTLCEADGDARQLFEILHAAWYAQMVAGELDSARASVDELARIAEGQPAPEFRLRVELVRGRMAFWSGHFNAAVVALTTVVDAVEQQPIEMRAQTYGVAPVIAAYSDGSVALWFLGHLDRARAWAARAMAHAEDIGVPYGVASALVHRSVLELLCGDADGAARLAARAAKVSEDNAVGFFVPLSAFFSGAALAGKGDVEGGLSRMLPALAAHRETVGVLVTDIMLGFIATACCEGGRWDEGLRWVDEGLEVGGAMGEHVYAAELERVKGELLLGKARTEKKRKAGAGDALVAAAEQCLRRALEVARRQGARSVELRSAMSLARLARWRRGPHDAAPLLRSVLASFTEGLDTQDLREARALLDTPSRRGRTTTTPADRALDRSPSA